MNRKVLITDYVWPTIDPERKVLEANGIEVVVAPSAAEATLASLAGDVDAIMFCFAKVSDGVLKAAKRCVVAARYGIGVDNIDQETATELGIIVTNVPDYCMDEVSDHVIGMLLALNRRLLSHDQAVKRNGWADVALTDRMQRLTEATLGIVGFGRIGRTVASKAKAFGMRIVTFDPILGLGDTPEGIASVSLEKLYSESDFITLHVPLIPATQHMIDAAAIENMKPGVVILNAARGGLIDEDALAEALLTGQVGGAGIDVLENVPPLSNHPLFQFDNVIITPHTAFFSQESTLELETRTAEEVVRVLSGHRPENLVNPGVLGRTRVELSEP